MDGGVFIFRHGFVMIGDEIDGIGMRFEGKKQVIQIWKSGIRV